MGARCGPPIVTPSAPVELREHAGPVGVALGPHLSGLVELVVDQLAQRLALLGLEEGDHQPQAGAREVDEEGDHGDGGDGLEVDVEVVAGEVDDGRAVLGPPIWRVQYAGNR